MWFVFALLSAVFAALTSILAKIGIVGVSSNLATAIRTVVVLVMAWGIVLLTGEIGGVLPAFPGFAITMPLSWDRPVKWYRWTSSAW